MFIKTTLGKVAEYTLAFCVASAMAYGGYSLVRQGSPQLNQLRADRAVQMYEISLLAKEGQQYSELDITNPNLEKVHARGDKMDTLEKRTKLAGKLLRAGVKYASKRAPEDSGIAKLANQAEAKAQESKQKIAKYQVLKAEQSRKEKVATATGGLAGLLLVAGASTAIRRRED